VTAYTLTKHTTIRDLTVAGGYSARTGGDSIANTNGWSFTIDQDSRFGYGAPADAATTSGSFGSITQTAASGGDILIDGTTVWLIPYNTGSGTLAPSLAGVTIGAVTCNTIGLYSATSAAPVLTGVATGWLKVTAASAQPPSSGTYTSDGFTYTITGAAVQGWIEIAGVDASTFTGNRLGKFQVRGAYFDLGTTSGVNTTTYQVPNNGKQLWIPSIEVQGATWTITGATWAAGSITYTTSATHDMLVGQPVTVAGVSPSGYNCADVYISDLTDTTFSIVAADPGTYTSGGTAIAYEQWPCFGSTSAGAVNDYVIYLEDTRRGKAFWNTNSTTSLALPTGVIRFQHDGTNAGTGGYLPPAGRKIRIPNVIFTNCTTGARNQNSIPHATLATRYDFTMTGAGAVDIDKASMCWYLSSSQAFSLTLTNSGFMSSVLATKIADAVSATNICIGQEAANVTGSGLEVYYCEGGTTLKNVVVTQAEFTGTGAGGVLYISRCSNVTMIDCVAWLYKFRTSATKRCEVFATPSLVTKRLHGVGVHLYLNSCSGMSVTDTKYTDTTGLRRPNTFPPSAILADGIPSSGVISGLKFIGYRAQNYAMLASVMGAVRGPLKVRNFGSPTAPLETGDGPYCDKSWSRVTTVCTVTHVAHGLIVGDLIPVYWCSSTAAVALADKTVTAVTADTFDFACTNAGDASGTLSYYFTPLNGGVNAGGSSNTQNLTVQRVYQKFTRTLNTSDNSNSKNALESCFVTFNPFAYTFPFNTNNDALHKFANQATGASASVYGTTWMDGPSRTLPDTYDYTWTRSGITVTLTTTSGYHNVRYLSTEVFEVLTSSDESALNTGFNTLITVTTAGDTANKLRLTGYNTGASSGTATAACAQLGEITIAMNEGTAESTHYTFTAGSPLFTGAGTLRMPTVGDQVVFESPYWIKGHTGFVTAVPVMHTATIATFWIEYQIDTGSGYSAWKTAFRQTATAVADGTAGAATVVQVAAADSWISDGDHIQTTTYGEINRIAEVVSGGGTTTLTLNKNHNTTFSNRALVVNGICRENPSIDWEIGFKLKVRVTTLIAGTGATNTVGPITFKTFTTAASRQIQLPLDVNTVTVNGLVTGSRIKATKVSDGSLITNIAESSGAATFTTEYSGDIAIEARKASGAPFYIPWITQITPVAGGTVTATALQQLDQ